MRSRWTNERRRDVLEFVHKYRSEIGALIMQNNVELTRKFVDSIARPELEYSPKTFFLDIFNTLSRYYSRLIH